jgi:hypothetical protein
VPTMANAFSPQSRIAMSSGVPTNADIVILSRMTQSAEASVPRAPFLRDTPPFELVSRGLRDCRHRCTTERETPSAWAASRSDWSATASNWASAIRDEVAHVVET